MCFGWLRPLCPCPSSLTCSLLLSRGDVGQGLTPVGIEILATDRHRDLECFGRSMDTPSWGQLTRFTSISKTQCVVCTARSAYIWARRCLQGSYRGQQLFVSDVTDAVNQCCLELDRVCGWRKSSFIGGCLSSNWVRPGTFDIRVLLFQATPGWEHVHCLLSATPVLFEPFFNCQVVAEISALSTAWSSWMMRLATELVCWCAVPVCGATGSPLASGWTLGEGDGERERERYLLHAYIHAYIHTCIQTDSQTYIHNITLHHITLATGYCDPRQMRAKIPGSTWALPRGTWIKPWRTGPSFVTTRLAEDADGGSHGDFYGTACGYHVPTS